MNSTVKQTMVFCFPCFAKFCICTVVFLNGTYVKLQYALGTLNVRILVSTSIPFRSTTCAVQMPYLAPIETKRISVYTITVSFF
jgi:hypothetical protein